MPRSTPGSRGASASNASRSCAIRWRTSGCSTRTTCGSSNSSRTDMKLVLSWLREFVDVKASAEDVATTLALRGFEVASIGALDGDDAVIDFEVTANRPDALSVLGLAREVATAYDLPLTLPSAAAGARIALA